MLLVALDLETTGLDSQKDQILEIGALCFDSETGEEVGTFEKLIRHDRYEGNATALAMNADLLRRLGEGEGVKLFEAEFMLHQALGIWGFNTDECERPYAVGFNVAPHDLAFLKAAGIDFFRHRAIEVGTMLMGAQAEWQDVPVSSKQWQGFRGEQVAHTALEDCRMAKEAYMYAKQG